MMGHFLRCGLIAFSYLMLLDAARAEEETVALDQVPKVVIDAIKAKFANAEILSATKEAEEDEVEYEITIKQDGKKIDVTASAKGSIESLEKELDVVDLPKVVVDALNQKYPNASLKEVEAVYEIEDGQEEFEYYEITIETADKKVVEVKVDQKGKIEIEEDDESEEDEWTSDFSFEKEFLTSTGKNPYFVLEPGYQLVLEEGKETLTITVLNEVKVVDGVETRVVEERETKNGELVEVSRNYFAISKRTNSVYYFGEDVDIYKDGKVSSHGGSWMSGVNNARFGLAMPGLPLLGARFQQEVAPGIAMDRAEIDSVSETVKVAAGEFRNCLKIEESSPLEPGHEEEKLYAPGVGLLTDGSLKLVKYGKVQAQK